MSEVITKHRTLDGEEFEDEAEASRHEDALKVRARAQRFAEKTYDRKAQVTRAVRVICDFFASEQESE